MVTPCFMSYSICLHTFVMLPYFLWFLLSQLFASADRPLTYFSIVFCMCSTCHCLIGKLFCTKILTSISTLPSHITALDLESLVLADSIVCSGQALAAVFTEHDHSSHFEQRFGRSYCRAFNAKSWFFLCAERCGSGLKRFYHCRSDLSCTI